MDDSASRTSRRTPVAHRLISAARISDLFIMETSTGNGLPRFVGYSEVTAALGVKRRTVERMVRDRKFPPPVQLSCNRVGWNVDVVLEWLRDREARVVAFSYEDVSEVDAQKLADGTARLGAALLSGISGQRIRPEDIRIGRVATPQEQDAIESVLATTARIRLNLC
jgi:predicted DNA-binding transcriptional regulator AlpA